MIVPLPLIHTFVSGEVPAAFVPIADRNQVSWSVLAGGVGAKTAIMLWYLHIKG